MTDRDQIIPSYQRSTVASRSRSPIKYDLNCFRLFGNTQQPPFLTSSLENYLLLYIYFTGRGFSCKCCCRRTKLQRTFLPHLPKRFRAAVPLFFFWFFWRPKLFSGCFFHTMAFSKHIKLLMLISPEKSIHMIKHEYYKVY